MKALSIIFAVLAAFFLIVLAINIHDFLFDETLPWKEGDFRAVVLTCGAGFIVFAVGGALARHRSKNKMK